MSDIFGDIIGGVSSLVGGALNSSAQKDANNANILMAQQNLQFQEDAAQAGITWKAQDARNAEAAYGINPLVSMGASTFTPSPVTAGVVANTGMGDAVASAGQALGRAANAYTSGDDRLAQLNQELVKAQIAQVNSETVKNQAAASSMAVQHASTPPGPKPLFQTFVDDKGTRYRLPSGAASTAMQNWASMPQQLGIAATQAGDAVESEYHKLMDPVRSWWSKHGSVPMRGDVWRSYSQGLNY
jgi:hypothetical protein